jgi:hypothetical protein
LSFYLMMVWNFRPRDCFNGSLQVIIERLEAKLCTLAYTAYSSLLALLSKAKSFRINCLEVTSAIGTTRFVTG